MGILDLAASRFASQLTSGLDERHQTSYRAGVSVAEHAAVGVDRKVATNRGLSSGKEGPALTPRGKSEFLHFDYRHDRETIIEHRDIDITGTKPCHFVSRLA